MIQNVAFVQTAKTIAYTYNAADQRLRKAYCNGSGTTTTDNANGFVYINLGSEVKRKLQITTTLSGSRRWVGPDKTERCGWCECKTLSPACKGACVSKRKSYEKTKKYRNETQDFWFDYLAAGLRVWQGGWVIVLS